MGYKQYKISIMNQVASLICYSFLITLASAETITYKDLKDNRIGDPQETCYRFTWAGVYDAEEDEGKQCEDYFPDDICFQPLLFTKNATTCVGSGLPDIECILQECNAMNATCTCKREQSEVCVKYTKFSKDGQLCIIHLFVDLELTRIILAMNQLIVDVTEIRSQTLAMIERFASARDSNVIPAIVNYNLQRFE